MKRAKILWSILVLLISYSAHAQMNPKIKLQDALKLIQDNYVDPVNDEQVVDAAIKAMLSSLDPHSSYISREEIEAMNEQMTGSFAGIGISFAMVADSTFITGINPDGPAARAGLQVGDRISTVDGASIFGKGLKNQDVMRLLRGEKGKAVKLGIMRKLQTAPLEFNVMRELIADLSINTSYMVSKNVGYISLAIFSQSTRREMDAALKKLKALGMTKLILDLQSNGGGLVEAAIGVADEFLPKEKLVFYSVTNSGVKDNYMTGGFGQFMTGDLVVLIDESTASSSEILTGALQDWDRAVVIGRRSFGKGIMQKGLELSDGSVIKLTAARYYTPSGRSIQKPYAKGKTDYFEDFNRRMASGELTEGGHVNFPDSLKHTTLLNKRTVYGGGGIMPDKFIPIDTAIYSAWLNKLMNSGRVTQAAFNYVQQNRKSLTDKYADFDAFDHSFSIDEQMIDQIMTSAIKQGLKLPPVKDKVARKTIAVELKAEMADMLYLGKGYALRVRNAASTAFSTALDILNNQKIYNQFLEAKPSKNTTAPSKITKK
ncbi:S41 family peptidase [Pedobacter alluvionis]|uniref:S41 family peptidase n=1 Tax=Pedobacter alluvionis TaxID=475253 RepID=A0A497Y4X7_9SPHI|nr:S41 family peptidase [Pedobacter alluvionis]RLJ76835.1 S41A family C-terminal processing peptidase-3 [Pedobacter alluvionis]TFB33904.1 S41 family peptidase [Pedobacter alluvionis]